MGGLALLLWRNPALVMLCQTYTPSKGSEKNRPTSRRWQEIYATATTANWGSFNPALRAEMRSCSRPLPSISTERERALNGASLSMNDQPPTGVLFSWDCYVVYWEVRIPPKK